MASYFWNSYTTSDNNTISNNRISNCYDGVHLENYYYWSYTYANNNVITGNIIDSFQNFGIFDCFSSGTVFTGNTITNPRSTYSYGILSEENYGPLNYSNNIINMSNTGYAGIYSYYNQGWSGGGEVTIANNFITIKGSGSYYQGNGIYMEYGDNYHNVTYNNVNVVGSNNSCAFFNDYDYTYSSNIQNNNFVNSGAGYAYWVSYSWANSINSSDYNNLYTTGSNVGSMDYSSQATLTDWQTYTSWDANSVSTDPGYNSSTDLHASSASIDGKATPIASITTDIDGQTRNVSTPDIGADEFTPVNDDAAVSSITNPSGNYCPGSQNIIVILKNQGINTLTSVLLTYKVNGITQGTYTWSGSLSTGGSASVNVGSYNFTSGTYSVDVNSTLPNGVSDLNTSNDHAGLSGLNEGLSGTYTIATSGTPDYFSFTSAINDLKSGGLCGSVVFNVSDGVYNENPQLNQPITNASSTNTITFKSASGDSSKCIVNAC